MVEVLGKRAEFGILFLREQKVQKKARVNILMVVDIQGAGLDKNTKSDGYSR